MSEVKFEEVDKMFDTQALLLAALAKHFGLPSDRIMIGSHIEGGKELGSPLEAVFRIALIDDDMVAAVDIMRSKENGAKAGEIGYDEAGEAVGVWLKRGELSQAQRYVGARKTPDEALWLIKFEDMTDRQKTGRPTKEMAAKPNDIRQ